MVLRGKIIDLSHKLRSGQEEYRLEVKTGFVEEFLPQYQRRPQDWPKPAAHFPNERLPHRRFPGHRSRRSPPRSAYFWIHQRPSPFARARSQHGLDRSGRPDPGRSESQFPDPPASGRCPTSHGSRPKPRHRFIRTAATAQI